MSVDAQWLTNFLFCHTRATQPDGRPLYAYKCRDKDYVELKSFLSTSLKLDDKGHYKLELCKVFCLYAAETFRREHLAGAWTWETIFEPLNINPAAHGFFEDWIERGLTWWKRPIIKSRANRRLLLVSVACEGGLPLKLLHHETAHLKKFFLSLLEDFYAENDHSLIIAEEVARKNIVRLPANLRQDVVIRLSGELVYKIKELQQGIGEALNPIMALDKHNPKWRNELPLTLEDGTVEALLGGLLSRSSELSKQANSKLRWRTSLCHTPLGWQVKKILELPDSWQGREIKALLHTSKELAPRLRLMLSDSSASKIIALLTVSRGSQDDAVYRREWLHKKGIILQGNDATKAFKLSLQNGIEEFILDVLYGDSWGVGPWVFKDVEEGKWDWLAEGTIKTKATSVIVLTTDDTYFDVESGGYERLGEIPELQRIIYRICGNVHLILPEQGKYSIRCGADADATWEYYVSGNMLAETLNENPVYRGCPTLSARDAQGKPQTPLLGQIEWKPVGDVGQWSANKTACYGNVWIRCVDSQSGVEFIRRRVDVVPPRFVIERVIGQNKKSGTYRFLGTEGAKVVIDSLVQYQHNTNEVEVVFPYQHSQDVRPMTIAFKWGIGRPINISLPYPQAGAIFQLAGQTLHTNDWIPLERLKGLRLLIQDPSNNYKYWLTTTLVMPDTLDNQQVVRGFRYPLPALNKGYADIGLHQWYDAIASLLATSSSLETHVKLEVTTHLSASLIRLNVARFDVDLHPEYAVNRVSITEQSQQRLGDNWADRIQVVMTPLWSPTEQIVLNPIANQTGVWSVNTELESGPWWIIARDGGSARFRPLLWNIPKISTLVSQHHTSELAQAIRLPIEEDRHRALNTLLESMGLNPIHKDWERLFVFLKMTQEFPPSSFDVLRLLINHPQTMAMALLKADDKTFDRVWSLAEFMPFSWVFVSVNHWHLAAKNHFQCLTASLEGLDDAEDIVWSSFIRFRERTLSRRLYWGVLCDWLQMQIFPNRLVIDSPLRLAHRAKIVFEGQILALEQELQERHQADEESFQSLHVLKLVDEVGGTLKSRYARLDERLKAIRYAPFLAAHTGLNGHSPDNTLIYELRMLRSFDMEWFDQIYAVALTLGLAELK